MRWAKIDYESVLLCPCLGRGKPFMQPLDFESELHILLCAVCDRVVDLLKVVLLQDDWIV